MQSEKGEAVLFIKDKADSESRKKWGNTLIEAGYTILPSVFITRQRALGLDPIHVNILLIMFSYWWTAESLPYPSKKTMARIINVDESTIRRRIKQMEDLGILKRIERRFKNDRSETNKYDFAGLIKILEPFALEQIEEKTQTKANKEKRIMRKKPLASTKEIN